MWSELTIDQRVDVFCTVVSMLHNAEIGKQLTGKQILFEHFGFGPQHYNAISEAHFFDLHNHIYSDDHQVLKRAEDLQPHGDSVVMIPRVKP